MSLPFITTQEVWDAAQTTWPEGTGKKAKVTDMTPEWRRHFERLAREINSHVAAIATDALAAAIAGKIETRTREYAALRKPDIENKPDSSGVIKLYSTEDYSERFGGIRLDLWPEGLVFWVGGRTRWKSWEDPDFAPQDP